MKCIKCARWMASDGNYCIDCCEPANKYLVTLEFPAPSNCYHGEVTWEEVEAANEEEAEDKARLQAAHRICVNRIELINETTRS